jgi:hypothetical protein
MSGRAGADLLDAHAVPIEAPTCTEIDEDPLIRVFFNLCAACFHDEEVNCKLFSALASPV